MQGGTYAVSNKLATVVSMGLLGRLPGYGLPQTPRMTGSGTILGATRNPSRLHSTTFCTPAWLTAWCAMSMAVSPAPRMTTVLALSKNAAAL